MLLTVVFTSTSNAQQKLIHYWHFNNFTTVGANGNPNLIVPVKADYSSLDTNKAMIAYRAIPGTSSNYLSYWDFVNPGDTTNAHLGKIAGNALRPRNPWDSMQIMCFIPTKNYQNITIKYATQRSGSGPALQLFDYSLDSGLTYSNVGLSITSFVVVSTANPMNLVSISITNPDVANQNNLIFRIRPTQGTGGTAGNNRFDNVSVEGDTLVLAPAGPPLYNLSQITTTNPTTGNPDSLAVKATIRGLVYGFNQRATGLSFLLKDNTGGITVFHATKNYGYNLAEGDSIWLTGTVAGYRGLEEFTPDTIIKIASGKTIKNPTTIVQLTESNENDLVKINNLVFYTVPSGGNWPTASTNILCHTQGLNDTIIVRVLATSGLAGQPLPTSALFNVAGMVQQFSTSSASPYAFNGYQLFPRYSADVISGLAPPDAVNSLLLTPSLNSISISWTKPSNYIDTTMSTLVFIKEGAAITTGTPNINSSFYTANADFTAAGTAYQNDGLTKCVFNADANTVNISGLNQASNYYALVYVVRNSDSAYSATTIATSTTNNNLPTAVTGISVKAIDTTSISISWVKPASYSNSAHTTLVFVKATSLITAGVSSSNVSTYTANTVFGLGTSYQNDAAAYCVYKNDSNFVTISNLKSATTYQVLILVVRDVDATYATTNTTGSATTLNPPPPPSAAKLIHYWNFNNFPSFAPASGTSANSFRFLGINADYSTTNDTSKVKLFYRSMDGISDMYATYWDAVTGDTVNQRLNASAGTAFRARNPSDSMQVILSIPTSHYKNITLSYACQKSSLASGAYQQNYAYSIDAGKTWKTTGLTKTLDSTAGVTYTRMFVGFTTVDTLAYNNPNLIFRIRFAISSLGTGDPAGLSGNNRFDNIAVEGDTTTVPPQGEIKTNIEQIIANENSFQVYPNPTKGDLTILTPSMDSKQITMYDMMGKRVYEANHSEMNINLHINHLNTGVYFINIMQADKMINKTFKILVN